MVSQSMRPGVLRATVRAERGHAIDFCVQQDVYQHLDLRKFLPKKWRHGRIWQCHGKLVETELKFVRKFHMVSLRSALRSNCRLTQTRLKFIRGERGRRYDL